MPKHDESNGKKYLRGHVDETIFNEFMANVFQVEGPKHGFKGRGIERAMKIYNQCHKKHYGVSFYEVAEKENIPSWELFETILDSFIFCYTETNNLEACINGTQGNSVLEKIPKKRINKIKNKILMATFGTLVCTAPLIYVLEPLI